MIWCNNKVWTPFNILRHPRQQIIKLVGKRASDLLQFIPVMNISSPPSAVRHSGGGAIIISTNSLYAVGAGVRQKWKHSPGRRYKYKSGCSYIASDGRVCMGERL